MAAGGIGTTGQGLTGGSSSAVSPPYPTGGGGGWKTPGESPTSPTISGSGGAGDWVSIAGSKVYYGGGGGGGSAGGTPGKGGIGGGGNGGTTNGQNGTPGTGGGGGGTNLGLSGSGGSGIVIIRYDAKYPDLKVTGNPIYQNIGEAKVYQFLSSGTANWESKTVTINDSSIPIPTYSIVPNATNVNEGVSVTFTVTTRYVRNNTTLYWKNSGTGTRGSGGFDDGTNVGTVTIIDNTGTIVRPITANNTLDAQGAGTIMMSLYTDSAYNNSVATATTVTINDSSWPDPVVTWPTRIIFDRGFDYSITGDKIGGTFTITNPNGYSVGPTSYPGGNTGNYSGSLTIATGAIAVGTYDFTFTFSSGKTVVKTASVEVLTYIPVEYLVVAGGGGGASFGGGGGAGGVRSGSGYNIVRKNTLNVNIGGSGTGGSPWSNGQNGGNSEINGIDMTTITAIGGGGGASYASGFRGANGGSGGGGGAEDSGEAYYGGKGTAGQGCDGGNGGGSSTWVAGGGGGATSAGGNAYGAPKNGYAGDGGSGYTWINGNVYGGGGGGACHGDVHNGAGGSGGGGAGGGLSGWGWGFTPYGGNGAVSTGGGGGGGGYLYGSGWQKGGNGGSGVVIIRYPSTYPEAVVPSNVASTNSDGYRTYTFTNSATLKIL